MSLLKRNKIGYSDLTSKTGSCLIEFFLNPNNTKAFMINKMQFLNENE